MSPVGLAVRRGVRIAGRRRHGNYQKEARRHAGRAKPLYTTQAGRVFSTLSSRFGFRYNGCPAGADSGPAPQDDDYDDLEQEEDFDVPIYPQAQYRSRQYDPVPHDGEIDFTDVQRTNSPLRPSEEELADGGLPYVPSSSSSSRQIKGTATVRSSAWTQDPAWGKGAKLWTPLWLTKTVLVIFVVVFSLMLLATALLFHFSQKNNGIGVQKEVNHYGWKYGPTACKASHSILRIIWLTPLQCWSLWVRFGDKSTTPTRSLRPGKSSETARQLPTSHFSWTTSTLSCRQVFGWR